MNRIEDLLFRALQQRRTYYLLAWVVAFLASGIALQAAWHSFDNRYTQANRADGNGGHATIDFGGQWLLGRMLVTGNGRQLYNRNVQREVLRPAYPLVRQEADKSDVDNLMYWTMGRDDRSVAEAAASFVLPLATSDPLTTALTTAACTNPEEGIEARVSYATRKCVGGPLYPPVNAFVCAPLALMPPPLAYRIQQIVNIALIFLAALGLSDLSRGRIWCPVAATLLILYPGFGGSINLGQNATLTLAVLVWGWALMTRGRQGWGGAVWGLLVFKPVWAMAFFLVPLLTGRWRFAATMVLTGTALALLTIPAVGIDSWFDWLAVGREASDLYKVEENWINLSRDLLSIPRRYLLDFKDTPSSERDKDWLPQTLLGWGLLAFVLEITVRLVVQRRRQAAAAVDGPPAAFLLLGAWMLCFHFMYYDVLLTALPVFLLFTEPRRYLKPLVLAIVPCPSRDLPPLLAKPHQPPMPWEVLPDLPFVEPQCRHLWLMNRMAPTVFLLLVATQFVFPLLRLGTYWGPPWDTFFLIGLWLWCGGQWLRHGVKVATEW